MVYFARRAAAIFERYGRAARGASSAERQRRLAMILSQISGELRAANKAAPVGPEQARGAAAVETVDFKTKKDGLHTVSQYKTRQSILSVC